MANIEKRTLKNGELSYHITVCTGTLDDGTKIRKRMVFHPEPGTAPAKAEKLAQKEALKFEQQLNAGYVVENNPRFREYAEYVLKLKLRNGLKRSTYEHYVALMPEINDAIGHMRLRDIRPMHLNCFYEKLLRPGARRTAQKAVASKNIEALLKHAGMTKAELAKRAHIGPSTVTTVCRKEPVRKATAEAVADVLERHYSDLFRTVSDKTTLSSKTVLEYHRLIGSILTQADKEMLVPYNAARKASPPKREYVPVNYFQPSEICDILTALESEPLKWQLLTHLLMITGCRRGEIAGLKWSKIDLEKHRLKIDSALLQSQEISAYETTTKTGNERYIPLPEETFALLRRYSTEQKELRLLMGDRWHETDFVFTQDDGQPIRPDSITQWLAGFSERHGLPHINPHAFRHTAASVMITHGTDVVTVSKMLGHAKVSTTEDIYSHVIEDSKQQACNILAEVYFRKKA